MKIQPQKPTAAYIGASWTALLIGIVVFAYGLWNAEVDLNEKGFFFTIQILGLFAAVSLQKTVRDLLDGISVTSIYYGLCWVALGLALLLLTIGLWNANLLSSEKGFFAMSFLLSLFGAVSVQKNVRDLEFFNDDKPTIIKNKDDKFIKPNID
jgi:uncharacterized membrane protein YiaA